MFAILDESSIWTENRASGTIYKKYHIFNYYAYKNNKLHESSLQVLWNKITFVHKDG